MAAGTGALFEVSLPSDQSHTKMAPIVNSQEVELRNRVTSLGLIKRVSALFLISAAVAR